MCIYIHRYSDLHTCKNNSSMQAHTHRKKKNVYTELGRQKDYKFEAMLNSKIQILTQIDVQNSIIL